MPVDAFLGGWVAAGLTLFMFSFLYKDNPFFKFGEHLYVGTSMGYTIVRTYYDVVLKQLYVPMVGEGKWWLLLPTLLGVLILMRFVPRLSWLSRISFAFIVGFGSGVAIPRTVSSYILQQVEGTLKPLVGSAAGGGISLGPENLNALLILIGVTTVLFYFFFSVEHKGVGRVTARVGIYFLMLAFGASFGYTVMARMSLLIGRFDDLVRFASPDYAYATPALVALMIVFLALWERMRGKA